MTESSSATVDTLAFPAASDAAHEPEQTLTPEAEPTPTPEPEQTLTPEAEPTPTPEPETPVLPQPPPAPSPEPAPIPGPIGVPEPPPVPEPGPVSPEVPAPVVAAAEHPRPAPVPPRPRPDAPTPAASQEATDLLRGAVTFGRVDADGSVYVLTATGDRKVGEFPDTAPNEALVYYVRKYEELVGQVDLLAQRLRATDISAKDARAGLAKIQSATAEPAAVGDLEGLTRWVSQLKSEVDRRMRAADAERAAARTAALAEREILVAEAEKIAATDPAKIHYKSAGDRMREILEEWKTRQKNGPRLDKPSEDQLWKRLSAARTVIDKGRRQHASEMAEQRGTTRRTKDVIITEAEALAASKDWRATGDAFRGLMDRWKAAGRLPRADDDELWAKFRDAQERFHTARTTAMSTQDEEYRGNLAVKEALLSQAEALLPVTNAEPAKRRLRDIQDKWDAAGRVPRGDLDRIEKRLQHVADTIRAADASRWTATNPEALARAKDVVRQLESGVAKLQAEQAKAEAAGDARGVERATTALEARTAWLDQARKALADLGR